MSYKVPITPSDVTEEWVCQTLKTALNQKGATVSKVKVKSFKASKPAEFGMLSSIFQAVCESFSEIDQKTVEHRVFIKIMPQDKEHKDLFDSTAMDVTEIECYNKLFGDLVKFEEEHLGGEARLETFLPKVHASGYIRDPDRPRAFFIMMEDLSPKFKMDDVNKGLSLEKVLLSLESLAHFHALGYAMNKTKGIEDYTQTYPFLSKFFHNIHEDKQLTDWIESSMQDFMKDIEEIPDKTYLIPKIEAVMKSAPKQMRDLMIGSTEDRSFLIHGDLWANNCLFSSDLKDPCILLDWQFAGAGSIFLDFATQAYLSMPAAQTEAAWQQLISVYHSKFESVSTKLGVDLPWDLDAFGKKARETGLFLCFVWAAGLSYELVNNFPGLKERIMWVAEKSVELTPDYFV